MTSLLILLVMSATACTESKPTNEEPPSDDTRKAVTAPIATIQKEFYLAALKLDDLDDKTAAQYKRLAQYYQEEEQRFLQLLEAPEAGDLLGKIIRLCPCQVDPDHLRLCPCPTPFPPPVGGVYNDVPTFGVYLSSGRSPEQEIKPEILKLDQGVVVRWDLNSAKYGDEFTVTLRDKRGTQTSMTMVKEGKEWFRVNPFYRAEK